MGRNKACGPDDEVIMVVVGPLFFYFLVYGFLGRKNGSVGRKKKKKKFLKIYNFRLYKKVTWYMEIHTL